MKWSYRWKPPELRDKLRWFFYYKNRLSPSPFTIIWASILDTIPALRSYIDFTIFFNSSIITIGGRNKRHLFEQLFESIWLINDRTSVNFVIDAPTNIFRSEVVWRISFYNALCANFFGTKKQIGSIMDGAKITYLGLRHLIRLRLFTDYLSFLGGEAQRPYLQVYSNTSPAETLITPSNDYQVNKQFIYKFCPLQDSSSSEMFPPPR